tara:strand:- start:76 stop:696 length:621 start_codon:yes stop_codon:yes gene_type:complete
MPAAYTGFGSGPYNTLLYDRSWVTAFVTLGVSASDVYTPKLYSYARVTLGTAVEAIKLADGRYFTSISLGFGVAVPAVSIGGNYTGRVNLGAVVAKEHLGAGRYNNDLAFTVSLNDQLLGTHIVNDTVTLGTSLGDPFTADSNITANLNFGTGFTYTNTTEFVANNNLSFSTGMTALVSSTGRFIEQWTSVTAAAGETWTSVPLGF